MVFPTELYTDGSSLRNPGASGLAYVIRYWVDNNDTGTPELKQIECSQAYRLSTNNRMEIIAVITGISAILEKVKSMEIDTNQINVFTDSEYVSNAINQNWIGKWVSNNWMTSGYQGRSPSPVKNKDLWEKIVNLQIELKDNGINLSISHVKGHSDNEFNNKCDQLAVAASNSGENSLIDEGYESTLVRDNKYRNNPLV